MTCPPNIFAISIAAAIEIAKILGGQVIATASSSKKLEIARSRGADHVINSRNNGFRDKIMEITSLEGVNAVYDPIGGEVFNESLRCLAPEGLQGQDSVETH